LNRVELYNISFLELSLKLFRTNLSQFFDPSEEKLFKNYLMKDKITYYLFFNPSDILVASSGYEYENKSNIITLTWGMVDQKFHNQGYGTYMTEYRLKKIATEFPNTNIALNTSQHTFRFYEKFGFEVIKITKNGYGNGLDKYDMILNCS